jgi:hypothetical protein
MMWVTSVHVGYEDGEWYTFADFNTNAFEAAVNTDTMHRSVPRGDFLPTDSSVLNNVVRNLDFLAWVAGRMLRPGSLRPNLDELAALSAERDTHLDA